MVTMDITHPKQIAERGEKLYQDKYKAAYEREHPGRFVAINVLNEVAYVADSPEEAIKLARKDSPRGVFHLIRVGSAGAFRVSYNKDADVDWLFQ